MSKVRVLRLIEYTYETAEDYLKDRVRWTEFYADGKMTVRSAVLPGEVMSKRLDESKVAQEVKDGPVGSYVNETIINSFNNGD